MRKLASVQRILKIDPIEGADAIEVATVQGWKVVVKKNDFKEGDLVVFVEIDSWIPTELAPFLSKGKDPREFNGVKGERLRTIRLRGQLSQGLILPLNDAFNDASMYHNLEGTDVTELLGIQKWEAPVNAQLAGVCRSTFPSWIPKTDQERCQNLKKEIQIAFEQGDEFEVTEKMDGSSMTIAATKFEDPEYNQTIVDVRVCSRNLDLKLDQEGNTFVNTAKNSGLIDAITRYVSLGFPEIAVQGELVGPGIQGNIYNLTEHRFYVFDIYDIRKGEYFKPFEREFIWHKLNQLGGRFYHVPVVYGNLKLPSSNIDDLLVLAEGPGYNYCTEREGLVFKSNNGGFSFKAISNKFLLGEK